MQHDTASLFQTALTMNSGEVIVVPCRDFREMEAIRSSFYRERRTLKKLSSDLAAEIGIHRRIEDGTHAVVLSKLTMKVPRAYLVTKDGTVTELERDKTDQVERIAELMLQDGCSAEEIYEYRKSQRIFSDLDEEEEE